VHSHHSLSNCECAHVRTRRYTTKEKGHGREEERLYDQMTIPTDAPALPRWGGLKTSGVVVLTCLPVGKSTTEMLHCLSSLKMGVENLALASA
jgi:hypothetical protein